MRYSQFYHYGARVQLHFVSDLPRQTYECDSQSSATKILVRDAPLSSGTNAIAAEIRAKKFTIVKEFILIL